MTFCQDILFWMRLQADPWQHSARLFWVSLRSTPSCTRVARLRYHVGRPPEPVASPGRIDIDLGGTMNRKAVWFTLLLSLIALGCKVGLRTSSQPVLRLAMIPSTD